MLKSSYKTLGFICLLVSTLFFIISCQKEITGDIDSKNILGTSSVEGRVTDESGMPVSGAAVKAGINTTTTDKNGIFKFQSASFTTSESFVTVSKAGYFQGSRTFFARSNSNNFVRIQLLRKTVSARLSAGSGGDVDFRSGTGTVHFEPNSFVTTTGQPYNGTVMVYTQYINPTTTDVNDRMPGDLRGTTTAGSTSGLQSFGMVAVELQSDNGQKLQIKNGMVASLNMAIPASLSATAPATIPLWYFNDSTGLWKEEGVATKVGDNYEGDVKHFTFWNCDLPYNYVKLKAHVVNSAGQAIAGAKVRISSTNYGYAYDYTDNNGYVDGFVPKSSALTFEVLDRCGTAILSNNIGPYAADVDLGNVAVTQNTITITGSVVACSGSAVADGYVQITTNGYSEFTGLTAGAFSYTFIKCTGNTTAQIIAVDNTTQQQGNTQTINLVGTTVNAGVLTACGVMANTFFNMTVNGVAMTANTSEYYRNGWKDTSSFSGGNCSYYYVAYDSTLLKYLYASFDYAANHVFTAPSSFANFSLGYSGIHNTNEEASLSPLDSSQTITMTEYGSLGQFISGNFTGQMVRTLYDSTFFNNQRDTVPVTLNFRVRHVLTPF